MVGKGIACLAITPSGATSCAVMTEAIHHGLAVGIGNFKDQENKSQSRYAVFGVAADWVRKIQVRIGRNACYISPANNVYMLTSIQQIIVVGQYGQKRGSAPCSAMES
jgi:hypothetical protein